MFFVTSLALATALSSADSQFLRAAIAAQLGRYALAAAAQKRGTSAKIRGFAREAASGADTGLRQLEALAKADHVTPPSRAVLRDRFNYAQLVQRSGKNFDRYFIRDVKTDDEIVLANDKQELAHGVDIELRRFARTRAKTLSAEMKTLSTLSP